MGTGVVNAFVVSVVCAKEQVNALTTKANAIKNLNMFIVMILLSSVFNRPGKG